MVPSPLESPPSVIPPLHLCLLLVSWCFCFCFLRSCSLTFHHSYRGRHPRLFSYGNIYLLYIYFLQISQSAETQLVRRENTCKSVQVALDPTMWIRFVPVAVGSWRLLLNFRCLSAEFSLLESLGNSWYLNGNQWPGYFRASTTTSNPHPSIWLPIGGKPKTSQMLPPSGKINASPAGRP